LNTIYAEFRTASSGSYGYSNPQLTAVDITLNATAPAVYLNSPTGILDPVSSPSLELAQQQWVNSDAGQWVTFSGAGSMGESMDAFTVAGCSSGPPCSPTLLTPSGLPGTATMWWWPHAQQGSPPAYTYLQVTGTDQSGSYAPDPGPPNYNGAGLIITAYSASTAAQEVGCNAQATGQSGTNPVTLPCTTLADQGAYDIPGDQPSIQAENGGSPYTSCKYGFEVAFSGYADPSMRRDPFVTSLNPYVTNLWMLYSYPGYWAVGGNGNPNPCDASPAISFTGVVETHLGGSATAGSSMMPGGTNWSAYCAGTCTGVATPIWPTEAFCTDPLPLYGGATQPCPNAIYRGTPAPAFPRTKSPTSGRTRTPTIGMPSTSCIG
jgi:hypothetical protein